MPEGKRTTLIKPSTTTPFHIDFDWWQANERDWHVYLRSLLCVEHQEAFVSGQNHEFDTASVRHDGDGQRCGSRSSSEEEKFRRRE